MKPASFSAYAVISLATAVVTLLLIFGIVFLEALIYPVFRKVAYMNVPEKEYYVEREREPAFVDIMPAKELPEDMRDEARAEVVDEYRRLYGGEYKNQLKEDIRAARKQLGDKAYENFWGPILEEYEK